MKNHPFQIGTDPQNNPVILADDRLCHSLITGGTAAERASVLRSLAGSAAGYTIPVFATDPTGKLSGLSAALPCTLWDINGETGLPLRTTATEFGPLLLANLLGLNESQSDLLRILIKIADDHNLLLIDTKDLKALLDEVTGNSDAYKKDYGTINKQTASSILRAIVSLETKGAENYLFEPAIDVKDFLLTAEDGTSRIHILDAREQESEPVLYAAFLLFLLGELCENLPDLEEGDAPVLVLLVDEAQLFLSELSASLLSKTRKLLEGLAEKGVMIFLSSPDSFVLPESLIFSFEQTIRVVNTSEVTLSTGTAENTQSVFLTEYSGSTKSLTAKERAALCETDPLHEKYKIPFDRDSAYEFLKRRGLEPEIEDAASRSQTAAATAENTPSNPETSSAADAEQQSPVKAESEPNQNTDADKAAPTEQDAAGEEDSKNKENLEKLAKRAKSSAKSLTSTTAGTIGRQVGKSIGSTFGSFGETLGGNIGASLGRGIVNTLFKS